jgi:alkylation response protein AidB-like acyl-CoA dehydrogenase
MTTATAPAPDLLHAARDMASFIREHSPDGERERCMRPEVFERMAQAGFYRALLARDYGGLELPLPEVMRLFEEVSRADGSTGWCLMIGTAGNAFLSWLDEGAARLAATAPDRLVIGGQFGATGQAVPVEGGYRVSGRWPFMSGIKQSAWTLGTCVVMEDGQPRLGPAGNPETIMFLTRTGDGQVIDNWEVTGLAGTGSHDFSVEDLFVPNAFTLGLFKDKARHPGANYRLPFQALLWFWMAPVPLGIARGALDDFAALAARKTPVGSGQTLLRDKPLAQVRYAEAEALLRSARALLYETAEEAWQAALTDGDFPAAKVAVAGLAARNAGQAAAKVTEILHELAGGTAIRLDFPLQRRFRDAHAATQHVALGSGIYEFAGRTLLNQPEG